VKKFVVFLLLFLSFMALILRFAYQPLIKSLGLYPRAGVRIESNQKAAVTINNKQVGTTPYEDENLGVGEYLVSLNPTEATAAAKAAWQGYVKLNTGTLTVVNRELADTQSASSGEVITLEKGKGVTMVSNPTGAQITIDGDDKGRTPMTLSNITPGEHQFLVGKENFLKRSIRATVVSDYNLTINVDLAISEVDLTKIPTVPISSAQEVTVKQTPTGFLRVRKSPNTNADEVGRVSPGENLTLIEESAGWDKIKLKDGTEGYVSSAYVEKKANPTASP
jgi:hypothetical protein